MVNRSVTTTARNMDTVKAKDASPANLPDGQELTELERSMVNIIQVFHSYSGEDCKLKKKDLKELINSQMSSFVKQIHDTKTLDVIFSDLDGNQDREIDFSEFSALVAMVTSACHVSFHNIQ
ncbi:protein S100-B-like [Aquarana catesbeiana]|uniref:protein S100-B-like n=1 Tax=Aquarana catesbeiana TaxID=8400 RepID=UPI003CC9CC4C